MKFNKTTIIGIIGVVLGGLGTMFCSAASIVDDEKKEKMKQEIKDEVLEELKEK